MCSPATSKTARKERRRWYRGSPMPTVDGSSDCRRGQPFDARVRATLRHTGVLPRALLRPLARQSRLLLQCLEKGSVRNKGQSAFSGGVFTQKRMRSWQYLSKAGNLNDNENAIHRASLFLVRLDRILHYVNVLFFITVKEKILRFGSSKALALLRCIETRCCH